jgi:twitching motility protein PilT
LAEVVRRKGSDLHLGVGFPPAFRVDGELVFDGRLPPIAPEELESLLRQLLTEEQWKSLKADRELDFSFTFRQGQQSARFRGNGSMERGNPCAALRLISTNIRTLRQLLLPEAMGPICARQRGLFLVTGPTGSGKSTTLAAIVQEINMTRATHVITIEDPIEYLFVSERSMIHQREVGEDTRSFAEALRRALRQDPDVIMIGEMRDLETVSAAVTAAETGHLVLATLHTPDAAQTIDRIVDVFPPHQQQQVRLQLANILVGICSQQLIPMDGGGRTIATELLLTSPAIRNCVREGKTTQIKSLMQTGVQGGMHSMDQDLARLVREERISAKQARLFAYDMKELDRYLTAGF